jgi:hypothetical protein
MSAPWRVVSGSVTGSAHLAQAKENQDAFASRQSGETLVLAVADGAGSRPQAALGARLAVETICDAATVLFGHLPETAAGWQEMGEDWVRRGLGAFDARARSLTGKNIDDLATTLLAVLARSPFCYFVSIGDGFLVVAHADASVHLVAPPTMDPRNGATVFLTSAERDRALQQGTIADPAVTGLALCSDGLLDIVLTADVDPAGGPRYYAPPDFLSYFRLFRDANRPSGDLEQRLASPEFAAACGDDKTMVLAVRP